LAQGKEPWLFGTYVSDFVGDFGYVGTLAVLSMLALASHFASRKKSSRKGLSLARLLLVIFLFVTPFWGVFYFRLSISNGFIVINLLCIAMVALLQGTLRPPPARGLVQF
jgi:hypothetical protein